MVVAAQVCEVQQLSNTGPSGLAVRGGAGRRQAAKADAAHDQNLKDIHAAQFRAVMNRMEDNLGESLPVKAVSAHDFCGNWTDSFGNAVSVYSTDGYNSDLVARLSRPPRADTMLHITPGEWGRGWFCGSAVLSHVGNSVQSLSWTFPNGSVSVWRKQADEMSLPGEVPAMYPATVGNDYPATVGNDYAQGMPMAPELYNPFDMSQHTGVTYDAGVTYVLMPYFVPSN